MHPDQMPVEPTWEPTPDQQKWRDFERDLTALLNRYSMELPSNTQDFVLADYLCQCLVAYNMAVEKRRPPEVVTEVQ